MSFHCSHSTGNPGNILRTESNSSCSISCIYIGNWRHCNEDFEYGLHCPILHIVQLLLEEPKASYHGRQRAQKLACLNIHNLAKKILRALYYDFMNDLTKKFFLWPLSTSVQSKSENTLYSRMAHSGCKKTACYMETGKKKWPKFQRDIIPCYGHSNLCVTENLCHS